MEALEAYNAAQTFKYEPITEAGGIRLLVLYPAESETTEIRCSLIHTTLQKCHFDIIDQYIALSYVWGDATITETILVDDVPLKVTKNLFDVLSSVRDPTRPFRVWADAICINQKDEVEKSSQVRTMGKIYGTANHTIIYLGKSDVPDVTRASPCHETYVLEQLAADMARQPWFTRVWVFQELVFSKDPWIQYGSCRWRWDLFCDTYIDISTHHIPHPDDGTRSSRRTLGARAEDLEVFADIVIGQGTRHLIKDMQDARKNHWSQSCQKISMMHLVESRSGLGATDRRDIIFAHSALADDAGQQPIQTDYSKSWKKVFTDFAVYQLKRYSNISLLFYANPPVDGLPSWAPDWTCRGTTSITPYLDSRTWADDHIPKSLRYKSVSAVHQSHFAIGETSPTLALLGRTWLESVVRFSAPISYKSFDREELIRLMTQFETVHKAIDSYQEKSDSEPFVKKSRRVVQAYFNMYSAWQRMVHDELILPDLEHMHDKPESLYSSTNIGEIYGESTGTFPDFRYRSGPCNTSTYNDFPIQRRPSIADCLVAGFDPNFNRKFLEGKRLALFSSGVVALVPHSVEVGDFVVRSECFGGWYRNALLLRACTPSVDEIRDATLRHLGSRWKDSFLHFPTIKHCVYVGPTFMHGLEFHESRRKTVLCETELLGSQPAERLQDRELLKRKAWSETIFDVH